MLKPPRRYLSAPASTSVSDKEGTDCPPGWAGLSGRDNECRPACRREREWAVPPAGSAWPWAVLFPAVQSPCKGLTWRYLETTWMFSRIIGVVLAKKRWREREVNPLVVAWFSGGRRSLVLFPQGCAPSLHRRGTCRRVACASRDQVRVLHEPGCGQGSPGANFA